MNFREKFNEILKNNDFMKRLDVLENNDKQNLEEINQTNRIISYTKGIITIKFFNENLI